jgi:hypothetical protein
MKITKKMSVATYLSEGILQVPEQAIFNAAFLLKALYVAGRMHKYWQI